MKSYRYGVVLVSLSCIAALALASSGWWGKEPSEEAGARSSEALDHTTKARSGSSYGTRRGPTASSLSPTSLEPLETPEAMASMDHAYLRSELERMEGELEDEHAIERMNAEDVTQDERVAFSRKLERIAMMRH